MKQITLILMVALTGAMAACGPNSSDPASDTKPLTDTQQETDAPADQRTPSDTTDPDTGLDTAQPDLVEDQAPDPDTSEDTTPPPDTGQDTASDLLADGTPEDLLGDASADAVGDIAEDEVAEVVCEPGTEDCDKNPENGCEATLGTVEHCSGCYDACSTNHATPACVEAVCYLACEPTWEDCNLEVADGCEQSLLEPEHCGQCDHSCAGTCVAGGCSNCDGQLPIDSLDPLDALRSIGLCDPVVQVSWVLPDGSPMTSLNQEFFHLGHGILSGFGPNVAPMEGTRFLALSSGTARQPSDPGYSAPEGFDKQYVSAHPAGFPMESPACPGTVTGQPHDGVGLQVTLKAPPFARGYTFLSKFYTYEWPQYICSQYNDFFIVLHSPFPAGALSGNVVFDAMGNPISVNTAFLEVCGCQGGPPCIAGGIQYLCPYGVSELVGTGFGLDTASSDHGATGWLRTTVPVEPGAEFTIRFMVYDSGDGILDSTVLIDRFEWLLENTVLSTTVALQ